MESTLNSSNINYLHYKISLSGLKIPLYILVQETGMESTLNINYLHYKISLSRLKIPLYILVQETGMESALNRTEKARISTTCIIKFQWAQNTPVYSGSGNWDGH